MPLRLKHLELHGYKSFAGKTDFVFGAGVSAIVGPNGSGKSNVVDGIRWVLGEQSYSLLRGKKTEDMIFGGSDLRPRAGMAQVTLTFDNSDGWLPIDFSEVAISRRAYRDGQNEYLLNGQRVRLRDLNDLMARVGLSERTYTIIGQGLIDAALALKPEERRSLFEEAAGIGLYRNKREDALKKLEATQRNLDRVLDILAEIKPRLRSLERQAQRARDFNQVKADLDSLLKIWYGYHWHRAVETLEEARVASEQSAIELFGRQSQQEQQDQAMGGLRAQVAAVRAQLNDWRRQIDERRGEREALDRELAVADERLRSLTDQRDTVLTELEPLEHQLAEQARRAEAAAAEVAGLSAEAAEAGQQAAAAQTALADRESERVRLRQREAQARQSLGQLDTQTNADQARLNQLLERRDRVAATRTEQNQVLAQLTQAEAEARGRVTTATAALNEQHRLRQDADAAARAQAEALRAAEAERVSAAERVAAARAELERLRARQEVLEHARAELAGFTPGAKALLARQFPARGVLGELLRVPAEYELAISAALGANLEALVLDDRAEAEAALDALGEASGRAALLPLAALTAPTPLTPPADPDCLGVAAQLVTVEPGLQPAADLLLGQVVIVTHRAAARRLLPALPQTAAVVTLAGEVFWAAGPVLGGREAASVLQQARERRDLSAELAAQAAVIAEKEAAQARAAQAVEAARAALDQRQAELRAAQDQERRVTLARDAVALEAERAAHEVQLRRERVDALEREAAQLAADAEATQSRLAQLAEARAAAEAEASAALSTLETFTVEAAAAQLARWQTAAAVAARAVQDAQTRAAELEQARAATQSLLADRRGRIERLAAEGRRVDEALIATRQRAAELAAQISEINLRLQPAAAQLVELEAEQNRRETDDTEARAGLHAAEKRNAQIQLDYTRKKEELEGLRRRVEEDFGLVEFDYGDSLTGPTPLPMYPIVEKLARVEALPDGLEDQLNRKRGQLRRMGAINPEAEREYLEVKERHDFLTTQVADLDTAKTQLHDVITELDVLMEREFRKTFDAVSIHFRETFTRLFGGGTAKLALTDPEHLTTSGVEIQCKLPGKRTQTLSMLSGGERSLTACALIFALLRVSPTPFCVLDEVDAMLDEANVGRYRDMLEELSQSTQFMIVTHNRNTVQVAETVYGITMGADSASQMISLKLDGERVETPRNAPLTLERIGHGED